MIKHKQLILNGLIDYPLRKEDEARRFLNELVKIIGMKAIIEPMAKYVKAPGNRGMTAAILIETSHIAFHIWDEEDPAKIRFDLYTCGNLDVGIVVDYLNRNLIFHEYPHWFLLDRQDSNVLVIEKNAFGVGINWKPHA